MALFKQNKGHESFLGIYIYILHIHIYIIGRCFFLPRCEFLFQVSFRYWIIGLKEPSESYRIELDALRLNMVNCKKIELTCLTYLDLPSV